MRTIYFMSPKKILNTIKYRFGINFSIKEQLKLGPRQIAELYNILPFSGDLQHDYLIHPDPQSAFS